MKVLQLIHSLRKGGAERVALEIALGLQHAGHAVRMLCLTDVHEYAYPPYSDVEVRALVASAAYRWPGGIPGLALRFRRAVGEYKPEAVEIHGPTEMLIASLAGLNVPAVVVVHGYGSLARSRTLKNLAWDKHERWAIRRLGGRVVVLTHEMRDAAIRHFACDPDRVVVVSNGVDLDRFPWSNRSDFSTPTIVVVGTLCEGKRIDLAIRSFAKLRERLPVARLEVVGDGPLRNEYHRMVGDMGLVASVRFWGQSEQVSAILARCHVMWQVSQSEGLGMVVLEGMATGLPVVGYNVRGTRSVVRDGDSGFLVDFGDLGALVDRTLALLSEPSRYKRMSLSARQHIVDHFTRDTMVDKHIACLQSASTNVWPPGELLEPKRRVLE